MGVPGVEEKGDQEVISLQLNNINYLVMCKIELQNTHSI